MHTTFQSLRGDYTDLCSPPVKLTIHLHFDFLHVDTLNIFHIRRRIEEVTSLLDVIRCYLADFKNIPFLSPIRGTYTRADTLYWIDLVDGIPFLLLCARVSPRIYTPLSLSFDVN